MAWQKQADGSWVDTATGRTAPPGTNPLSLGGASTPPGALGPGQATPDDAQMRASSTGNGIANSGPTVTSGTETGGLVPYSGFASQYAPGQLNSIYDNPWYLISDALSGANPSSPGYQALRDFGADPLALFNVMAGANGTIATGDQGAGAFANFMADLYQNLGTPGGAGFNAPGMLKNVFGQQFQNGESQTTLGNLLLAGDMGQQIRTLFNLLRDISSAGMNPLASSAYQAAVARAGDRYGNEMIKTKTGEAGDVPMVQWMRQNMPWLTVQ